MTSADARTASTVHVRTKPPRRRGNQWYRDNDCPPAYTLCGAPVTDRDLSLFEARTKRLRKWCEEHVCPACMALAIRGSAPQ